MGGELKRPVLAFAIVSVLCAVLMIVSTGRVDAVLGVFDAPRPISGTAPTSAPATAPAPAAVLPDTTAVVTVPDELTAIPVGAATGDEGGSDADADESTLTRPAPARTPEKPQAAAKADRKADRAAAKVEKKADKAAAKAAKKAHKAAAKADRKANKDAAKAAKKADKG